jgi:magnesium transporter
VITIHVRENGVVRLADRIEPDWLAPSATATVWVDMASPTDAELGQLNDVFHFHPLSIEDARSRLQFPKVEQYPGYLYVILHGIDATSGRQGLHTRDVDFFVSHSVLVTVHDGTSVPIAELLNACSRYDRLMAEGPVALFHRIIDAMVDNYRPAIDGLEARIDALEEEASAARDSMAKRVIRLRHELSAARRVLMPQRDVIGRLARREFPAISDELSYRFRDVYDHVVRVTEETLLFQDRVTGILEVHLAAVSNRLNQVMKVLTVMSTIFLPLTVLTGMWGMNVPLPHFPGGPEVQFWWVAGLMALLSAAMLVVFKRNRWL